jgi:hypothetical protein
VNFRSDARRATAGAPSGSVCGARARGVGATGALLWHAMAAAERQALLRAAAAD